MTPSRNLGARPGVGGARPYHARVTPSTRTVLVRLVLLNAGIRVVLEVIGLASLAGHGQPVLANAIDLWNRWDAHHFLRVAEVGYRTGTPPPDDPLYIVFFPFFPLAVRAVSVIARDVVLSGLFVSFAASVGAGFVLHRLVALDAPEDESWRAVALLYAFPTAYFLSAPYSEALFLFAVLACLYAARIGRWPEAAVAGALATGTRVTGVALAPALAAEALRGRVPTLQRVGRLVWAGVAGAGLLIYLVVNQVVYGDPFWFLDVQRSHWSQAPVPPWQSILDAVQALVAGDSDPTRRFVFVGRILGFAVALPMLVLAIRRLRVPDSLYAWGGFVLILSTSWLLSLPRYLLVLYPIFIVGAQLTRSLRVFVPIVVASCVLQVWLMWRYAVGHWTF